MGKASGHVRRRLRAPGEFDVVCSVMTCVVRDLFVELNEFVVPLRVVRSHVSACDGFALVIFAVITIV